MGDVRNVKRVKLICGLLAREESWLAEGAGALIGAFGPVERESPIWRHDYTDYYAAQMGAPLLRKFLAFAEPLDPGELAAVKLRTNELETALASRLRADVVRPVNLDPGYIALDKLVLASTKDFSHRVYVGRGIYAEVTLQYRKGRWAALPWTYPDYAASTYHSFLTAVRESLRATPASASETS